MNALVAITCVLASAAISARSTFFSQSLNPDTPGLEQRTQEPEPAPDPRFVYPKSPLAPSDRPAPSPKVLNGSVFESGTLNLAEGQTLVLPANTVVNEHDGATLQFYLTKTVHCAGQPPVPMRFDAARKHFGIAQRVAENVLKIATFGEWSNRGGSATIGLVVLVPRGTEHQTEDGLHGAASQASSKFEPGDKDLKACYWYAGPRPAEGWQEIDTHLHFARFLAPR